MKKKKVCVILSVIMTVVSLSACGGSSGGASDVSYTAPMDVQTNMDSYTSKAGAVDGAASDSYLSDSVQTAEEAVSFDMTVMNAAADLAGATDEAVGSQDWNTEEYSAVDESGFQSVANNPLSTFSADVDTASYSNIRRMIESGYSLDEIPSGAVRIEEMLNYFSYDYRLPKKNEPFGVTTVIGDCPWNGDAKLLQIGLKTQEIDFSEAPDSNLVFLLDVSGSMYSDDKLPLLQKSFSMLVGELGEKDTVSIVTYAGSDRVVLEGESGDNKERIIEAINALEAGGSTNGADGIETA